MLPHPRNRLPVPTCPTTPRSQLTRKDLAGFVLPVLFRRDTYASVLGMWKLPER